MLSYTGVFDDPSTLTPESWCLPWSGYLTGIFGAVPFRSDALPALPAGVYRHYRGALYHVFGYASDSTNGQEDRAPLVAYMGLELTACARPGPRILVRDAAEFFAVVDPETGQTMDYPHPSPQYPHRFTYQGASWDGHTRSTGS